MSKTLDQRALRAFVAVAQEGNVSRAAERLHLTQPAVSLQLKQLAEQTGLTLFARSRNGLLLTRDGAALLPHAERALQAHADVLQAAQRMKGSVRGVLRVGTIQDPDFIRLGAFLRELVALAPEVQPQLQHGMSGQVMARVIAGELDVGYTLTADEERAASPGAKSKPKGMRGEERLHIEPLTHFAYRVVAPPGWAPQVQGREWPDLVRLPWVLTPPESVHSRLLAATLEPLGLRQNGVAQVDQEPSMLALVRSGVGLSLVRDALALQMSQAHGLVLADRVSLGAVLGFACLPRQRERDVVALAFDALKRAWGTGAPAQPRPASARATRPR